MQKSHIVANAKLLNGEIVVLSRNDHDDYINYRYLTDREKQTGNIEPMGNYEWHQTQIKKKWSDGVFSRFVAIENTFVKVNQLFLEEFTREMMETFRWESKQMYRK